jgi:5-methylcytosine-specific restriction enzyme A
MSLLSRIKLAVADHQTEVRFATQDKALGVTTARSPEWPRVRREWLAQCPTCAACGTRKNVEVHHKQPFHLFPALELDPKNFITLCEQPTIEHHLHVGHLGNWKNFNPNVVTDAAKLFSTAQGRPNASTS